MALERVKSSENSLLGLRVLLVEDEFYIADDLARALSLAGASVVGPCPTVAQAQQAVADRAFDFAILDLNLHGESGAPIAEHLLSEKVPFAFATGYGSPPVPDRFQSVPRCEKPFDPEEVIEMVARSIAERATESPDVKSRPAAKAPE